MDDQIIMIFLDIMNEGTSIPQAEEAAASSSTRRPKHYQRYVNRDCEAAHFSLRYDYF
jgi:hypothetical protein